MNQTRLLQSASDLSFIVMAHDLLAVLFSVGTIDGKAAAN